MHHQHIAYNVVTLNVGGRCRNKKSFLIYNEIMVAQHFQNLHQLNQTLKQSKILNLGKEVIVIDSIISRLCIDVNQTTMQTAFAIHFPACHQYTKSCRFLAEQVANARNSFFLQKSSQKRASGVCLRSLHRFKSSCPTLFCIYGLM